MPLIDLFGPGIAECAPKLGRADRVIADLGLALGMLIDPAAEMARQHLSTKTNAKERFAFLQRHRDPAGLAAHEFILIVGAHRAAEDDGASVLRQRIGQRIAKAWPADVEWIAALLERVTDPAGRGIVPVQDDQDWPAGCGHGRHRRSRCWASTPAAASPRGVARERAELVADPRRDQPPASRQTAIARLCHLLGRLRHHRWIALLAHPRTRLELGWHRAGAKHGHPHAAWLELAMQCLAEGQH